MYDLADAIIGPLRELLLQVLTWLSNVQLVAARGINPGYYLGWVAWAGSPWLDLVRNIMLAASLYGVLYVAVAGYRLYLDFKSGVKWW